MAALLVHKGVWAPDGQLESPALHPPPGPGRPPLNRSGREARRHELRQLRSLGAHGLGPAVRVLASSQDLPLVAEAPPKVPPCSGWKSKGKRSPQVSSMATSHPVLGKAGESGPSWSGSPMKGGHFSWGPAGAATEPPRKPSASGGAEGGGGRSPNTGWPRDEQ